MSDGRTDGALSAIPTVLTLANSSNSSRWLTLRDTGVGGLDVGFYGPRGLWEFVPDESTRLFDGVSDEPHGFRYQEMTS